MIPAYFPTTAPPGEQAVYRALASAPGTDRWIAMHSLAIAKHVRQVEGEADFVIIAPGEGILVIEVKSHRSVRRDADGTWHLGAQPPTTRSPFQQAGEAMYSILDYLRSHSVDTRRFPAFHAVWFTHVRAKSELLASPEWHAWQLLDMGDLADVGTALGRVFAAGRRHLASKNPAWVSTPPFTIQQATLVARSLRPRFEVASVSSDMRHARQRELTQFLDEQYDALDAMDDNSAVLFTGPAGSGKTLLAMEAAVRELSKGKSGRLLCFNHLLGQQLQGELANRDGLTVGTLHQQLLRIAGVPPEPVVDSDFWQRTLPERAAEALLESASKQADFLIIDEIQDIASQNYLDVLDLLVDGGLRSGRVLMFGDFERQAIYDVGDSRQRLHECIPYLATFRLVANCRNLPRIGFAVNHMSQLDPGYTRYRRHDDGVDPSFLTYKRGSDQTPLVVHAIRDLQAEGFRLEDIVVLSPLRQGSAAETATSAWLKQVLIPADASIHSGKVAYSTVQAFKGLEAPAVVFTDLDSASVPNFAAVLYVGITRATDRLTAVAEQSTLKSMIGGPS
ncbi:MAG: NERD domain-containing protein [Propionibacteriaceae bacterium]|nr:NERD domain-containing protein [Propionibacteriaceae bacterium]